MDQETRDFLERLAGMIGREFQRINARFDAVDARFNAIDARFDGVDARFADVYARLDGHDRRLERLEVEVIDLRREMRVEFSRVHASIEALQQRNDDEDWRS